VKLIENGKRGGDVKEKDKLPAGPFQIYNVYLSGNNRVTDADLVSSRTFHVAAASIGMPFDSDDGLSHLQNLTTLEIINLSGAGITGTGLSYLRNMGQCLRCNCLNRKLPTQVLPVARLFQALKRLEMGRTKITDLRLVTKFKALESLDVGVTQVKDLAPIEELANLASFGVWSTRITDDELVHLKTLPKLNNISLWETAVTDKGIQHLEG